MKMLSIDALYGNDIGPKHSLERTMTRRLTPPEYPLTLVIATEPLCRSRATLQLIIAASPTSQGAGLSYSLRNQRADTMEGILGFLSSTPPATILLLVGIGLVVLGLVSKIPLGKDRAMGPSTQVDSWPRD